MDKRCSKKESISWWHAPSKVFAYVQHCRSPIFFAEWTKLYSRIAISKLSHLSIRIEILQRSSAYCRGTWCVYPPFVSHPTTAEAFTRNEKKRRFGPSAAHKLSAHPRRRHSFAKGAVGTEQHVQREPPWSAAAGIQSNTQREHPGRRRPGYMAARAAGAPVVGSVQDTGHARYMGSVLHAGLRASSWSASSSHRPWWTARRTHAATSCRAPAHPSPWWWSAEPRRRFRTAAGRLADNWI